MSSKGKIIGRDNCTKEENDYCNDHRKVLINGYKFDLCNCELISGAVKRQEFHTENLYKTKNDSYILIESTAIGNYIWAYWINEDVHSGDYEDFADWVSNNLNKEVIENIGFDQHFKEA